MADTLKAKFDASGWDAVFKKLDGPIKESLARRMGVSGAAVIRDEAKLLAPKSDGPYNDTSRGSHASGTLANSIYLVFNDRLSSQTQFTYSVTWSDRKAWWGKLIEFGHWQTQYKMRANGTYFTPKGAKPKIKWIVAKPFLAPAYDNKIMEARAVMIARGQHELPILLRGQ